MGKKKSSIKLLELDKYLGSSSLSPRRSLGNEGDDIDDLLKDVARRKVQKAKMLALDKYLLEETKDFNKLRAEMSQDHDSTGEPGKTLNPATLAWAKQLAEMPEQQRQSVIAAYVALVSAEKGGVGAAMMPMLLGFSKANPGASQGDMLAYATALSDQFSRGIETAQRFVPGTDTTSTSLEMFKVFKDLIQESVKRPLEEALKQTQPQSGFFEQMVKDPALFSRIKELGLFGHPAAGPTGNIALEIERLRGERELGMKKLELEWKKAELQRQAEDRRADTLLTALTPMAALFAGPVDAKMRGLGQRTATGTPAPPTPTGAPNPKGLPAQIACSCGYEGTIKVPSPPPQTLTCPKCGQELLPGERLETPSTATSSEASPAADGSPQNSEAADPQWSPRIHPQFAHQRPHDQGGTP